MKKFHYYFVQYILDLEKVPTSIVSEQSLSVDTVAGATVTSNAIIDAVKSVLESAKK